ncbi:MAG: hypothetical protein ACREME_08060, partial [Gemmatimonadales bacterium]
MWKRILTVVGLAAVLLVAACSDRMPVTPPPPDGAAVISPPAGASARRPDQLARQFARALRDPAFRAYLKAQLD